MSQLPRIERVEVVWSQDADSNSGGIDGDVQTLTLRLEDAGGGPFYTLTSDRWAFDAPEELLSLMAALDDGKALMSAQGDSDEATPRVSQ